MDFRRVASVCLAVFGTMVTAVVSMGLMWIWLNDHLPESPLAWLALVFIVASPIVSAGIVLARVCSNSGSWSVAAIVSLAYLSGLTLLTIFSLGAFLLPGVAGLILALIMARSSRPPSRQST